MDREEEKMAAMDAIEAARKDVDRLGEFASQVQENHRIATIALMRFDFTGDEADKLIAMFIAAGSINDVREECEKFSKYFERQAGGRSAESKKRVQPACGERRQNVGCFSGEN